MKYCGYCEWRNKDVCAYDYPGMAGMKINDITGCNHFGMLPDIYDQKIMDEYYTYMREIIKKW